MGESSKPLMKSTVMLEVSTAVFLPISSSDQASKLHTSFLMRALADPVTRKAPASSKSSAAVVLGADMAISAMGSNFDDLGSTGVRVVSSATAVFEALGRNECRRSLIRILGWFKINFLLSPTWEMGLKLS